MLALFISAVAISVSGVMALGPVTAATLAAGVRSLRHAAIEMPLIFVHLSQSSNCRGDVSPWTELTMKSAMKHRRHFLFAIP